MRIPFLLLAASLAALPAVAADAPKLEPVPDIPPPPGMVENEPQPEITIRQRGGEKVEEYRVRGKLYLIKVTPAHGRPYYLVNHRGDGQFERRDDLSPDFRVPMWVLFEF